ncbi:helix-turn-helix domain-containing protein [Paenibacillus yanchengensis]|uniref:Helix-turn-helix domain-containing protein n=1 Tax=Paenibacillus yanchengensis TaxID=2035833 RepID=A0ABW4YN08_9BACL
MVHHTTVVTATAVCDNFNGIAKAYRCAIAAIKKEVNMHYCELVVQNIFLDADKDRKTTCRKVEKELLMQNVLRYVEQHYLNLDLIVDYVGRIFNYKPSYLSQLLREHTGKPLLEYIHICRIEHAKKTMEQHFSLSIYDIATKSGYIDMNSFYRVFKKYVGISPGQYRSLHGMKDSNK